MKKRIVKTLLSLISLILICCALASCSVIPLNVVSEDKRCDEFLSRVSKRMNSLASYTCDEEMNVNMSYRGAQIITKSKGTQYFLTKGKDFKYYSTAACDVTTKLSKDDEGTLTSFNIENGYQDGYMFSSYSQFGRSEQQIKSPISANDYRIYMAENEENLSLDLEALITDAETKSIEEIDGVWMATLSGIKGKTFKEYKNILSDITSSVPNCPKIVDIKITVSAEKGYIKDYAFETIFENSNEEDDNFENAGAVPLAKKTEKSEIEITYKAVFRNHNKTKYTPPIISNYDELEDLRVLDEITEAIENKKTRGSGSIDVRIREALVFSQDNIAYNNETDKGTYSLASDTVDYDIYAKNSEFDVHVAYEMGVKETTVSKDGVEIGSNVTTSDDYTEKLFLEGFIDPGRFDKTNVNNVQIAVSENNTTTYTITMIEVNEDIVEAVEAYTGKTAESSKGTITLKITEKGNITYYKSDIYIDLYGVSGSSKYTCSTTVNFE